MSEESKVVRLFTAQFETKAGSVKKMTFVLPSDMPDEFIAQRVKGTGKTNTYPAGMALVWSATDDGWRVWNAYTTLKLTVKKVTDDKKLTAHFKRARTLEVKRIAANEAALAAAVGPATE
jgi:hypothetical protein